MQPVKIWFEEEGRLLRLRLSRPKANLIDAAMIGALDSALSEHIKNRQISAVLLDAEGPHFSFGASVEEHLPKQCAAMLEGLHRLVLRMVECPVPLLTAIRGQCLGGGLEGRAERRQLVGVAGPDEEVVAEVAAQAGERGAGGGLAEADPVARAGDVALLEQGVEGDQEVEVEARQVHMASMVSMAFI